MRQKDRRLSFFATSIKRRIPNVAKFPKKSATEKPSSRIRHELGAKFRNRAGFCIFFALRRSADVFCFLPKFATPQWRKNLIVTLRNFCCFVFQLIFRPTINWFASKIDCKKNDIVVWRLRDWFPGRQVVPTAYPNHHLGHVIDHSYSILPKLKKCYRYWQSSFWYCCWDLNYLNKPRKNWQRVTLLFSSVQEADDESTMLPIFGLN